MVNNPNPNSGSSNNSVVFNAEYNEPLIHQVVNSYLATGRSGTKAQLSRAKPGGGIKPWRQKGTGRARSGSSNSPIWGGSRAFAAKPRSFKQKVNKKMYRAAMRSIISELLRSDRAVIVENFTLPESPKTKLFIQNFSEVMNIKNDFRKHLKEKFLLIFPEWPEDLELAARNLYNIAIAVPYALDPVTLLRAHKVMITKSALQKLEEVYDYASA